MTPLRCESSHIISYETLSPWPKRMSCWAFRLRRRRLYPPLNILVGFILLLLTCVQLYMFHRSHAAIQWIYYGVDVDVNNAGVVSTTMMMKKENHFDAPLDSPSSRPFEYDDNHPIVYPDDGFPMGIRSNVSIQHLRRLQRQIDQQSHVERCRRYGYVYHHRHHNHNNDRMMTTQYSEEDTQQPKQQQHYRRIFYGAIIANEPWELLEIVAAEAYGIFQAMVLVESNRTQNFAPRHSMRSLDHRHGETIRPLFGVPHVQIRSYVNEDPGWIDLDREHSQRNEILQGWKELGMTANDIGYLADLDETFSRDFLRAAQVCDGIPALDYEAHRCGGTTVKLLSKTRVFEMSPECAIRGYAWHHPDLILGACVELIGNSSVHPVAPRSGIDRAGPGIGGRFCGDWRTPSASASINDSFPLWTPGDIRSVCGGKQASSVDVNYDTYTGYHFHNFFSDLNSTRLKYYSFAHPNPHAMIMPLEDLNDETMVGVRCLKNISDNPRARHKRVIGGFDSLVKPTWPLYFLDRSYRQQRHSYMQNKVMEDETAVSKLRKQHPHLIPPSTTKPPQKERRRRRKTSRSSNSVG